MTSVKDQVFAITGGASGIGLATAKLLASRGAKLSLADVQDKALEQAAQEIRASGAEVLTTKVDVRKSDEVDAWIKATISKFGKLDGAANLAGVTGRCIGKTTAAELENDDWDFVISIHLTV